MTDDLTATWRLVDSVRDRSYDIFTHDEKLRLHNIVLTLKSTRTASDRQWLEESDANLRAMRAPVAARGRPYEPWLKRPRKARARA